MKNQIYAADIHVRNFSAFGGETIAGINARGKRCVQVLRELCAQAKEYDAEVVIAGDVFDQHAPPPQLVAEVASVFRAHEPGVRLLVGNHDAFSDAPGDHGIGVLNYVPNVKVYSFARVEDGVLYCPFRKAPPKDWIEKELREGKTRGAKYLVAHFGMITKATPPFLVDAVDAFSAAALNALLIQYDYDGAILGNWHWPETFDRVHQCGTLIPQKFDGAIPAQPLLLKDGKFRRLPNLPSQPRFASVTRLDSTAEDLKEHLNKNTFVRVIDVSRAHVDAIRVHLEEFGDRFEIEVAEREPAQRSELVVGLDAQARGEVLADFVHRTYASEPEDLREEVLARVRSYGVE